MPAEYTVGLRYYPRHCQKESDQTEDIMTKATLGASSRRRLSAMPDDDVISMSGRSAINHYQKFNIVQPPTAPTPPIKQNQIQRAKMTLAKTEQSDESEQQ